MDTFRIVFISLTGVLLVPSLYFFIRKMTLKNKSNMTENDFIMISRMADNLIVFVAQLIFSALVIALNITGTLNVAYNLILLVFLILFSVIQIIICREKFIIKNDEITVIPILGRIKKFNFSDIESIKEFKSTKGRVLYTVFQGESEMFVFSDRHIGARIFISRAQKQRIKIISVE